MDELDGVIVAPDHHRVLFENDVIRIIETTIPAGEVTPVHTHLAPTAMDVISGSHVVRRDPEGGVMRDTRADPSFVLARAMYSPGTSPHTLENTDADDVVMNGVEPLNRG